MDSSSPLPSAVPPSVLSSDTSADSKKLSTWTRWGIGLAVTVVVIIGIYLALHFTILQKDTSPDIMLIGASGRRFFEPGDIVQVTYQPSRPDTTWALRRSVEPFTPLPLQIESEYENGIRFQIPASVVDETVVLEARSSSFKETIEEVIALRPILRIKHWPTEDGPLLRSQQTWVLDLDWSFKFPSGQMWAMSLSPFPDFREAMELRWSLNDARSDFYVDMMKKQIRLVIPERARLMSYLLYWRLSTVGLKPRDVSVQSPLPLRVSPEDVSPNGTSFVPFKIRSVNIVASDFYTNVEAILDIGFEGEAIADWSLIRVFSSTEAVEPRVGWSPLNPTPVFRSVSSSSILMNIKLPTTELVSYTLRVDVPAFMTSLMSRTYTITNEPLLSQLTMSAPSPPTIPPTYTPGQIVRVTLGWTQATPSSMFGPLSWEHSFTGGETWVNLSVPPATPELSVSRQSATFSYGLPNQSTSSYQMRVRYRNSVMLNAAVRIAVSTPSFQVTSISVDARASYVAGSMIGVRVFYVGTWPTTPPTHSFTSNLGAMTGVNFVTAGNGLAQYTMSLPGTTGTCVVTLTEASVSAVSIPVIQASVSTLQLVQVNSTVGIMSGATVTFRLTFEEPAPLNSVSVTYRISSNSVTDTTWVPTRSWARDGSQSGVAQADFVIPQGISTPQFAVTARLFSSSASTQFSVQPVFSYSFPPMDGAEMIISQSTIVSPMQSMACFALCTICRIQSPTTSFGPSSSASVRIFDETAQVERPIQNQVFWVANGSLYLRWYITQPEIPLGSSTSGSVRLIYTHTDSSTNLTVTRQHPWRVSVRLNTRQEAIPVVGFITMQNSVYGQRFLSWTGPRSLLMADTSTGAASWFLWVPLWRSGFDPRFHGRFCRVPHSFSWTEPLLTTDMVNSMNLLTSGGSTSDVVNVQYTNGSSVVLFTRDQVVDVVYALNSPPTVDRLSEPVSISPVTSATRPTEWRSMSQVAWQNRFN
jgi:hypothetical protein